MMMMLMEEEEEAIILNVICAVTVLNALPIELWEANILPRNLATNETQLNLVT